MSSELAFCPNRFFDSTKRVEIALSDSRLHIAIASHQGLAFVRSPISAHNARLEKDIFAYSCVFKQETLFPLLKEI